ncbi:MAG: DUF1684 domain-containing protein [Anaerolineales bacterium]|nr:DUF1684 domain-containing protein [Anaerolineales bacterium]
MTTLERLRAEKDAFFRDDPYSPLTDEQKQTFLGLEYFPENESLRLVVAVQRLPDDDIIQIQTNIGETRAYERYGKFAFHVDGKEVDLTIFRSMGSYFLPFADSLAGDLTYGAGRYLEPEELSNGRFRVDFNLAYNPYCAYNDRWTCPLTPAENRIKVPVRAGEKIFAAH